MLKKPRSSITCSFCGKGVDQVEKIIELMDKDKAFFTFFSGFNDLKKMMIDVDYQSSDFLYFISLIMMMIGLKEDINVIFINPLDLNIFEFYESLIKILLYIINSF